jgi:hypothetical protein
MTEEQRLFLALEMSLFARELARARITHERPGWTEAQIERELMRLAFLPEPLPVPLSVWERFHEAHRGA